MRPIGGFFELELPHGRSRIHPLAHALSTGRACLMVILEYLMPRLVYVPFYTCDAALEPFVRLGIQTRYYSLDKTLFPHELPPLKEGEYLLWTNYFGICSEHTRRIKEYYEGQVILDDTHAFFQNGHSGYWSFTSARKYFGVPDGAFLYAPVHLEIKADRFTGISLAHGLLRRLGRQEEAYEAYKLYERSLDCNVHRISEVSEGLLRGVDTTWVADVRRQNFNFMHAALKEVNCLPIGQVSDVPFCYPYLPASPIDRNGLNAKGIFVPSLWPDIASRGIEGFDFEKRISVELLPLPIDHRYTPADLQYILDYLRKAI